MNFVVFRASAPEILLSWVISYAMVWVVLCSAGATSNTTIPHVLCECLFLFVDRVYILDSRRQYRCASKFFLCGCCPVRITSSNIRRCPFGPAKQITRNLNQRQSLRFREKSLNIRDTDSNLDLCSRTKKLDYPRY